MRVERPFAYCCAEGGGRVEACDCVNKNHGTAWLEVRDSDASLAEDAERLSPEGVAARAVGIAQGAAMTLRTHLEKESKK